MVKKTISFAAVHFTVAFSVAYLMSGSLWVGGAIALVEPSINSIAYYFHEKMWRMKMQPAPGLDCQCRGTVRFSVLTAIACPEIHTVLDYALSLSCALMNPFTLKSSVKVTSAGAAENEHAVENHNINLQKLPQTSEIKRGYRYESSG